MNTINVYKMFIVMILTLISVSVMIAQTVNYIPKFLTSGEGNSIVYQSANGIGINNTNALGPLYINGTRTYVTTQEGLSKLVPTFSGNGASPNVSQHTLMIAEPNRGYGQTGDGLYLSGGTNYSGNWSYTVDLGNQAPWSGAGWMFGVSTGLTVNTARTGSEIHMFGVNSSVNAAVSQAIGGANDQVYGVNASITGTFTGNTGAQMAAVRATNTAISPTNIAGYFSASGGTNNYGILVPNGKVGIGTTTPRALVVVSGAPNTNGGNGSVGALVETYDNSATGANTTYGGIAFASFPGYDYSVGKKTVNNSTYFQIRRQDGVELLTIDASGNTGIGTTSMGTAKLAVEGKIEAREVVVTSTNPFPDYVFENNYQIISLDKLEQSIKDNKRLPDMPSSKEVERNGLNLGEMQVKLLKKVEELTLYVIDLKKENDVLKKRVSTLEK